MKITEHKINEWNAVTVENNCGMTVTLCARGAGIASIKIPDKNGVPRELTKPHAKGYGGGHNGLTTGRTAGRIKDATFTLDGRIALLEKNNFGVDNRHGGGDALHVKLFDMKIERKCECAEVIFSYMSPNGEGGYFGNVLITATYTVFDNTNAIELTYNGVPDCKTLLNITNHVYFDASGDLREKATEQELYIAASRVGVLAERAITVGVADVTPPFDFRMPHKIGEYIKDPAVQLYAGGYDHVFFLDERGLDKIACSLYSAKSGITISARTTYPCAVIFTDNSDGNVGVCFECQYHPDGIHLCSDDCGICSPDKPYRETIRYEFSVK